MHRSGLDSIRRKATTTMMPMVSETCYLITQFCIKGQIGTKGTIITNKQRIPDCSQCFSLSLSPLNLLLSISSIQSTIYSPGLGLHLPFMILLLWCLTQLYRFNSASLQTHMNCPITFIIILFNQLHLPSFYLHLISTCRNTTLNSAVSSLTHLKPFFSCIHEQIQSQYGV